MFVAVATHVIGRNESMPNRTIFGFAFNAIVLSFAVDELRVSNVEHWSQTGDGDLLKTF